MPLLGKGGQQNATIEDVRRILTPGVQDIIQRLAPFIEFEMTNKEYQLLKCVNIEGEYKGDDAMQDLDRLIDLVEKVEGKKILTDQLEM